MVQRESTCNGHGCGGGVEAKSDRQETHGSRWWDYVRLFGWSAGVPYALGLSLLLVAKWISAGFRPKEV